MSLKHTEKREAIFALIEEMQQNHEHLTAEEIFMRLKKQVSHLSFSTVYRNLEKLINEELIKKIPSPKGAAYYDAITAPHHHIRCKICGRVDDLSINIKSNIDLKEIKKTGYEFIEIYYDFIGICPACKNNYY